jgi:hypothetical protein
MEISCFHGIHKCFLFEVIPLQEQFASVQPWNDYLRSVICLRLPETLYTDWPVKEKKFTSMISMEHKYCGVTCNCGGAVT